MKYDANKYVGKLIQLYPGDTYHKFGIIESVDDLGWSVKITKSHQKCEEWEVGYTYFISHSKNFTFKIVGS